MIYKIVPVNRETSCKSRLKLSKHLVVYCFNRLGGDLGFAIVSHKTVDLLLDISQLGVTKSSKELERSDPFHQVAILLQKLFIRLKRSVKPVKQIAFLRWNVFRYREKAADFRQHDRLPTISRATREERLVYPDLRR